MNPTRFEPYGPFRLPRSNGELDATLDGKKRFWKKVEAIYPSLPDAIGCYIFALKAGKGFSPWCVGKTENASFKNETWQVDKLLKYGRAIRAQKGTPVLFLLAKVTPTGRFKRQTKRNVASITALEEMLVGTCLERKKKLFNIKATNYPKTLRVPGYINELPRARSRNARELARLLKT